MMSSLTLANIIKAKPTGHTTFLQAIFVLVASVMTFLHLTPVKETLPELF